MQELLRKFSSRNNIVVTMITGIVIVLGFALPARSQTPMTKIRIGLTSPSITELPIQIAIKKGFFKDEKLDPQTIVIRSADIIVKALLSGQVDYSTSLASLATAALKGLPIKVVGVIVKKSTFVMVSESNVASIKDLKGKAVGIASYGGAGDYAVRVALQKGGLNPKTDVTILQIGGSAARLAALRAGTLQATVLGSPYDLVAEKMGYHSLLWLGKVMDLPQGGLGTYEKKLQDRPDEVVRTMKAIDRGIQFVKDSREESIKFMMEWLHLERKIAEGAYQVLLDSLADFGIADDSVIESALEAARFQGHSEKQIPLDQIRNWTFAKKAQTELLEQKLLPRH